MQYYCNICRKDITKEEFLYSIDKFDKPLCREHQRALRSTISEKPMQQHIEKPKQEESQSVIIQEKPDVFVKEKATGTSTIGGFLKKVAITTGHGIVKGVKTIVDTSNKKIHIHRWKDQILRRMDYSLLKSLCREKNIATKTTRTDVKEGKDGFYYKDYSYTYTFDELVGRIKLRVKLDDIISFAKRNHVNIRDILQEIDTIKSQWQMKELTEEDYDEARSLVNLIEQAILEFKPYRRYYQEILYQDTLASHLRTKFTDREVEIEKQRGSSRPDIVVDGVAIEIKGPTNKSGLISVADKCMRYKIHYPKGLIIVLFDVDVNDVNDYYYKEWAEGLKRTHPGVIVIRK